MRRHIEQARLFTRAMLALAMVRVHLKTRGFGATIAAAGRWGRPRPSPAGDRSFGSTETIALAIARAGAFFPGRAICLEQSLALYILLRRANVDASLRVGVETMPFAAHAWVEVDGQPVNEPSGLIDQLSAFPALLP